MGLKAFPQVQRSENYVLVIEDSLIDFEAISRTFKRVHFFAEILHWDNGAGAIEYLLGLADKNQTGKMPSLILLDLNMPGMDGREVLMAIKNNQALKHIPVIILSTSENQSDIEFSYEHGAEKFFRKPTFLDDFAEVARTIKDFWEQLPS